MISIETQFRHVLRLLHATPILSVAEAQALQRYVTQLEHALDTEVAPESRERVALLRDSVVAAVCAAVAEAHNVKMRADLAAVQQVRRPVDSSVDRRSRFEQPGQSLASPNALFPSVFRARPPLHGPPAHQPPGR